jgi:manganese/zinc/iron transport system permease protein
MSNDFQIILAASLVSASCSLLGCFLVLRKMAMVGDAISHAVLPGIVLAFLITGSRDSGAMLTGAVTIGILTTFFIEFFHKKAKLQSDAAIGVTFTWLFAIGVILISVYAGKVDLDQDCVLYGEIAYVPLDLVFNKAGEVIAPKAIIVSGSILILVLGFVIVCYRRLFLTTFDPAYASAIGISTVLWHYLLMGAVSVTTVASFESVGAILVVALIVAPAASAYLLTDDFKKMLALSVLIGIAASAGGYYLAASIDGSIAGAIATVCGVIFLGAALISSAKKVSQKKAGKPA